MSEELSEQNFEDLLPGDEYELTEESGGYRLSTNRINVLFNVVLFDPQEKNVILAQVIQGEYYVVAFLDYEKLPELSFDLADKFDVQPVSDDLQGIYV